MFDTHISIIVPFYNRIDLLEKTIQSVLIQTSNKWELVLVNDGTEVDMSSLYKKYNSSKVHFINKNFSNKGANHCRNVGANEAKHEYIMFLDSDDLLTPWCIEERIKEIDKHRDNELYFFNGVEFDSELQEFTRLRTIFQCEEPLREFLNFQSVAQTSCAVWCKKTLDEIGGWDETVKSWQDGEIFVRYLAHKNNYVWSKSELPDVLIRKHSSDNRISNTKGLESIKNLFQTYNTVLEYLNEPYLSQFRKNTTHSLYDFAEGINKQTYADYVKWINTLSIPNKEKKSIKLYAYLYASLNRNMFMTRFLYQIRKTSILFNKRQGFWSIRPEVSKEFKIELDKLLALNEY
jgi:glycosyltransferase involved in cell wall biosynthesis